MVETARDLLARAARYRELARWFTDQQTNEALLALAAKLEQQAQQNPQLVERPSSDLPPDDPH